MKLAFEPTSITHKLFLFFLLTIAAALPTQAQNYWEKVPALTTKNYSENDDFGKRIELIKSEIKQKLETSKHAVEEKANKMTQEERMAIATKYQNMKPEEIIKMQNEMMEMTQAQTVFQQKSSEVETSFNQLESDFRTEFGKRLGAIEHEYQKLPDGEGTPDWAIKKGEELMAKYNAEYESLCAKYFTGADAKFKTWLKEYNKFLIEHEVPFNQKMLKSQYGQFGLSVDESVASLMAIEKYLDKCQLVFGLRRPYPQG